MKHETLRGRRDNIKMGAGDKIEKNEMGRACDAYGGGEGGV